MAIDLRAEATCNLGPLINASISDDYIQGSGLIKTSGSCQIYDTQPPAMGTVVTFSYTKNQVEYTIPRKLRVLSSFLNPFTGIVDISLGCKLTYLQDLSERFFWTSKDDFLNEGETQLITTLPINAISIAQECLNKIGISAVNLSLTNRFSVASFDFSPGYVNILSNLLVSESQCGYLNFDEQLVTFDITRTDTSALYVDKELLIDAAPVNSGDLAGQKVVVNYSTLRLSSEGLSEDTINQSANNRWEVDDTTGAETSIFLNGTVEITDNDGNSTANPWEVELKYKPRQYSKTVYDQWGRVDFRVTFNYSILGATAAAYVTASANTYGTFFNRVDLARQDARLTGGRESVKISIDKFQYKVPARSVLIPEDYDQIVAEINLSLEPRLVTYASIGLPENVLGQLSLTFEELASRGIALFGAYFLDDVVEETSTLYEQGTRTLLITPAQERGQQTPRSSFVGKVPLTKTKTFFKRIYAKTTSGQRDIANLIEQNNYSSAELASRLLVDDGFEVSINTGREVILQTRPDDNPFDELGKVVENASDLEFFFSGIPSTELQNIADFSLPYAPDDVFVKSGTTYISSPSDAPQKAIKYGTIQNQMLFGNRFGMSIQMPPEIVPSEPFSPIAIGINNAIGLYKTNGLSWTLDSTGVIVGCDALFWGGIGGSGAPWFPVAPGIEELPAAPPVVDGYISLDGTVPIWNQKKNLSLRLRSTLRVASRDYPLELSTTVPGITIRTQVIAIRKTDVNIDEAVEISLIGFEPLISGGVSVGVLHKTITISKPAPAIVSGGGAVVPVVEFSLTIAPAPIVPRPSTLTNVPDTSIELSTIAPIVATGYSAVAQVVTIDITVLVPKAGGILREAFELNFLLGDDLLSLGQ